MNFESSSFKTCPFCESYWSNREDFLKDPQIEIVGYQADLKELERGLFYFNHLEKTCGTTVALPVASFSDLYTGPIYKKNLYPQGDCPNYCLYKENLKECKEECECAYVREVLQIIKNWSKDGPCHSERS